MKNSDIEINSDPFQRRKLLAQVIAGTVVCIQFLNVGSAMNYSTILLAGLSSGDDIIKPSKNELSWIGSICFMFQAIGSIAGGLILEPAGRKKSIIISNIPYIIAWILMWFSQNLPTLLVANALLGLGTGLIKTPVLAYLGETCEPSVRGVITTYSSVFTSSGLLLIYFLGSILPWRTSAAACLLLPLISILIIFPIPDSPIWILSKGRKEEALKSLCWLRGWVDGDHVAKEFNELTEYNEYNSRCRKCPIEANECHHKNVSLWQKLKNVFRDLSVRESRRPLILACLYVYIMSFTGHATLKPNMINVFKAFNMSVEPKWAMIGVGILAIAGALTCMALVKMFGKRAVILSCMCGSAASMSLLANYAYDYLPHDSNTYGRIAVTAPPSNIPLVLWIVHTMCNATGMFPMQWVLISEIFPYRTRGISCGISMAMSFIMNSISIKTNINIEDSLHIYGSYYFYALFTVVGIVYVYFALPETENRSHEEIEANFASKRRIFADDFIFNAIKSYFKKHEDKKPEDVIRNRKT